MGVAFLSGQRSKDPRTQVGACIVNKDKRIVSTGYNGMPNSCSDDDLPWEREEGTLKNKHLYVCHAEMNAVVNTFSESLKGCTMYVSLFPCNECTKIIIQAGITEIWYYSDKKKGDPKDIASRKMLRMAKVKIRRFPRQKESIKIDFNVNENS
ncbi:hypothetical protein DPMN_109895 [Dreissena polymorpha]|uniref:dCMP deaminase n=1 Tax=Dreissena polymorpha TaxID=45954 RepID=A0A9D4KBI9_DREPO|nr:hypothetical protein DPMN_109895 [Dreissena polymorpha]